jgi:hypothetical protein
VHADDVPAFHAIENDEHTRGRMHIIVLAVREVVAVSIETASSPRTEIAEMLEAAHDVLPFDLWHAYPMYFVRDPRICAPRSDDAATFVTVPWTMRGCCAREVVARSISAEARASFLMLA